MERVSVPLTGAAYDILIGPGLLGEAAAWAAQNAQNGVVLVSDETVWQLHGGVLSAALRAAGVRHTVAALPPGEASKSMRQLQRLCQVFAKAGLGRGGLVIAFGGGVVGDIAGFAASVWMRGIRYIQLPTTLLAQVDSSVGGKTAINLPQGKNLVGTFWQPQLVLADTALLNTLPPRQWRCGIAEMVKIGVLFSPALLGQLAAPLDTARLPALVQACCQLKSDTVQADERDTGRRMLLNFGHSFGHAIEKLGGYEKHTHGEAVAMGMVLAAAVGEAAGVTKPGCRARLEEVLTVHQLPTRCPYPAPALLKAMLLDKKGRDGGLDLVLLRDIGQAEVLWQPVKTLRALLEGVV